MISQGLTKEIQHEGGQTKKMLERIPMDKFTWKPVQPLHRIIPAQP